MMVGWGEKAVCLGHNSPHYFQARLGSLWHTGCNILFMVSFLVKICYLDLWRFALCCCHIYLSALRSRFEVFSFSFFPFFFLFATEILEPLCLVNNNNNNKMR